MISSSGDNAINAEVKIGTGAITAIGICDIGKLMPPYDLDGIKLPNGS